MKFLTSKRIRLLPTKEQEELFKKSVGAARWAYNFSIAENDKQERLYKAGKSPDKYLSYSSISVRINHEMKPKLPWLTEVSAQVIHQATRDAHGAYNRFFKNKAEHPKFKSKRKSKQSFFVRPSSIKRKNGGFIAERLGFIKTCGNLPKISDKYYSNPRIIFYGDYWYITVSYHIDIEQDIESLSNESLGIDLGTKELATCSNGMVFHNINKSKKMEKLERRKHREERKLSRKLRNNTKGFKGKKPIYKKPLSDCKNYQKQAKKVGDCYRKLTSIRNNYIHQTTTEIVKTKPSRIVVETLNIKGMMKNKHLAKSIQDAEWYKFQTQLKYKCERKGIEFVKADRWFPSSKICSCCGNKKKFLKLSERIYKCDVCGLHIDRDMNAAINLANY